MHDFVRDVLFEIFRRAGVYVKKEAPANYLSVPLDGRIDQCLGQRMLSCTGGWEKNMHEFD